jgi:hypothetical protein
VKLCPPIVSVPLRAVLPAFGATEYPTVPLPLPLAPEAIVIQVALLRAVQEHALGAVTATLPLPPTAATEALVGEIANVQVVAACVTVNVCPAIVRLPVMAAVLVLAATV